MSDYQSYRNVVALVRRPTLSLSRALSRRERKTVDMTLETYMSYGLGSNLNGRTVTEITCSNDRAPGVERGLCPNTALMACAQCSLVKYCSGRCQRQHWPKHRQDCESSLNRASWQPNWILENRPPIFSTITATSANKLKTNTKPLWGRFPGYDILQLQHNEGLTISAYQTFKVCFAAASDIRNVIQTVNNLPQGYQGKCHILFNDPDAISANRSLLVLYILMSAGPSIDEAAELALHLMYSSRLTATGAAYVHRCSHLIYGDPSRDGNMTFQRCFPSRGRGKLFSAQPVTGIKRPIEMLFSRYELPKAMRRMRDVLFDPLRVDERHKRLAGLEPPHRLAHVYFWKTGVLAPFSLDVTPFTHPNRFAFSPQGSWLGKPEDVSPLQGWDISKVQATGSKYGLDPAGDIFGCLFFHIKQELREFITRIKDFYINIHHTQYDSQLLSKGISIGVLPSFADSSFDRIDLGDVGDRLGISECLADWGPLLKKSNAHSSIILFSSSWNTTHQALSRLPLSNPDKVLDFLKWRCRNIPSLEPRLKKLLQQGSHSPSILRLIESLDAFIDYGPAFQSYLETQNVTPERLGLQQRKHNRIHPKRFGIALDAPPRQNLPDISREEYYNLFSIGGADLITHFAEFELQI